MIIFQIYTHNDTTVVKVYDRYPRGTDTMSSFSHVYNKPEQGVSMDQFRKMVGEHILKRLGSGDHSYRVQQLMNVADANKDDKVIMATHLREGLGSIFDCKMFKGC